MKIRLSKSVIGEEEKQAVFGVLDREFLGMGQEVQQFEKQLSKFFRRTAVCVSSGTAALHLALQAVGVGTGDDVLVPSLTYLASFQAISATGARPIACDVVMNSLTIDWRDAEKRLTPNTKAIMVVHYASSVGELDEIYAFAKKNGLRVVEDAAHSFGSTNAGRKVGSFGDIICFSFDGIKNITSGEGGCVVTDDEAVIAAIQDTRLLGVHKDTDSRYSSKRSWDFDVTSQGWRYHMSNIMAAIGMAQLPKIEKFAASRRSLAERYEIHFKEIEGINPIVKDFSEIVPHIYVIQIQGLKDREGLRKVMLESGIETGIHYLPNHYLTLYKSLNALPLPVTDGVYSTLLTLPLHPDMSTGDVDFVVEVLLAKLSSFVVAGGGELSE